MTGLTVRKDTGELLFDTSKICYGFVKSGYLVGDGTWYRYIKPYTSTDPDLGSSWIPSPTVVDRVFSFSLSNFRCPIVFLVGPGTLTGTSVSGGVMKFIYTNASTETKYYCFDLMSDNIPGGPYLKTRNEAGEITFNSLQRPLNVVSSLQAPPPPGYVWGNYRDRPYQGGTVTDTTAGAGVASLTFRYSFNLDAGVEYAACLPWSRSARAFGYFVGNYYFGVMEGAYGEVGKVTFMFGPAGATVLGEYQTSSGRPIITMDLLPTDRYPTALVIKTAGYPFPYG